MLPVAVFAQAPATANPQPEKAQTGVLPTVPGESGPSRSGAGPVTIPTAPNTWLNNLPALFKKLDVDGDGKLSRDEFAKLAAMMSTPATTGTPASSSGGRTSAYGTDETAIGTGKPAK